jgi:hypothetical protein
MVAMQTISTNKYITTYFRSYFKVTNAAGFLSLSFNLLRDDGAVIYLNGAELYRDNMPTGAITYTTLASSTQSGAASWIPKTVALSALTQPLRDGTNVLAVEVHQILATSSDILLNLEVIGNPAAASAAQSVYLGKFDSQIALAWGDPSFTLLQATNLSGPWVAAPSGSPFLATPTEPQMYYRLYKP